MKENPGVQDSCPQCGRAIGNTPNKLEIAIEKGHVRRASAAANGVFVAAHSAREERVEEGVVFMTALLLVERLATAHGCDPRRVLREIGDCFDFKDQHLQSDAQRN